jgi:hypothetical protein
MGAWSRLVSLSHMIFEFTALRLTPPRFILNTCRYHMGWIEPIHITQTGTYEIVPSCKPGAATYLIDHRMPDGYVVGAVAFVVMFAGFHCTHTNHNSLVSESTF